MVVREDGSKWACHSCLKGHRVSGCTHTDRELVLVPKKGRPVSQCQHCRLERKKRSAHVSCDCGSADKPHHDKGKCIHLREAQDRAAAGLNEVDVGDDPARLARIHQQQGCCCRHGGKCSCATFKNDTVDSSATMSGSASKPRLEKKTRSEGAIAVLTNGHHKPPHRKNVAAHGTPYKTPVPRAALARSGAYPARRSVDSLAHKYHMSDNSHIPPSNASARQSTSPGSLGNSQSGAASELSTPNGNAARGWMPSALDVNDLELTRLEPTALSASSGQRLTSFEPLAKSLDDSYGPWPAIPSAEPETYAVDDHLGLWSAASGSAPPSQTSTTAASSGTYSEIEDIPEVDESCTAYGPYVDHTIDRANVASALLDFVATNYRHSLPPGFFGNTNFSVPGLNYTGESSLYDTAGRTGSQAYTQQTDRAWQTCGVQGMGPTPRQASQDTLQARSQSDMHISPSKGGLTGSFFPEVDIDRSHYAHFHDSPSQMHTNFGWGDFAASETDPFDFGTSDVDFVAPQWGHNSTNVPDDNVTMPMSMDMDFIDPGFAESWMQ